MVQNQLQPRVASDPLSAIGWANSGPVRIRDLAEADIIAILQSARPHGGRRRDGYYEAMKRQWWVNILYYMGFQSLTIPEAFTNFDPGLLTENGGYVANHVLRMVLGNVARLSSAKLEWSVTPRTPDQADQDGAKAAQHLLDYYHDELQLPLRRIEIGVWLDVCGTCFGYANWDHTKGEVRRVFYDPMTKQPVDRAQLNPQQLQFLQGINAYSDEQDGELVGRVVNPFDVIVPPRYDSLEKMPWMLIRETMSLEEVWNRWDEAALNLPANDPNTARFDVFRNRLSTLARRPNIGYANQIDDDGAVDVDHFWYPPSKRMPEGLYIAACNDAILHYSAHPFAEADMDVRFPVVDFHNIRQPGRFHSQSTVEHLIGPQFEYNRSRQQVIQHRDILSVAQWIAPIGTLSKGLVRNELGDVIEYKPNIGKPELVNPAPLGDAQLVSGQQAQSDMQMIASFSDASLGNMPQGARSGNAVSMLQERDSMGITPTVTGLEWSYTRYGSLLLKLSSKFLQYPRAVVIYGEARQSDIRYLKGADLNGNTRVRIRPGSMVPKSRQQVIEEMNMMTQMGILNPMLPDHNRLMLEAFEIGASDKLHLMLDLDRRRARIENTMFSKPDPDPNFALPDVQVFDDHQAHYEVHLEFMKTDEFERMHPMMKMMLQAHVQKHVQAVAQMMQAQQMAAQAAAPAGGAGNGPPGAGGGSPQAKPLGKPSPPRQTSQQAPNP